MDEEPKIIISIFNSPTEDQQIVYGLDAKYNLYRRTEFDTEWKLLANRAFQVVWPDMGEKPKEKLSINDIYAILARQAREPLN